MKPRDEDDARGTFEDALFLERFKRRKIEVWPSPDSSADPKEVVASILAALRRPYDPVSYSGYDVLYARSTPRWRDVLRRSVGAPRGAEPRSVARALGASMERPRNQFGLLVGAGRARRDPDGATPATAAGAEAEAGDYALEFPHETLDYFDGTAWVECRLRDARSGALLAALGWSMAQGPENGDEGETSSWLIDGLDWQDFREQYRPGIGREEWERICG